ncbi:lytic transglycosylase domain-containing protein [Devosia rhodophyticola]|uniref:Lytic transglycosylase domain-containing protein n=1 Tax=Devosia rhodophyticola TaxID=3026423 RepID=A0ABY7YXM2_9HYPH|nr:lytic transglycosylase domain-containing protein [Devosia rhodophyticola]WDR06111.1 lytic transglycosylase domain-containing protein [Devosia rhodophyticola]
MNNSVAVRLFALLLGATCLAPVAPTVANETIDQTTTGSINANVDVSTALSRGTVGFSKTLDLLVVGDAVSAYASAKSLGNTERRAIQWAAIYFNSGKIDADSVSRFAKDAPDFASPGLYKTRLEQSLSAESPTAETIIARLGGAVPNTIDGQISLASAYAAAGQKERAATLARNIWVENYLTGEQETKVLDTLGTLLTREAHWARAVHLMMNDRASGSERLLPMLSTGQQSLVVARAAVSRNESNAKALLDKVDPAFQNDPVYIFSRVQRARQAGLLDSAVDWLAKAKGDLPDADDWWYERRTLLRAALSAGKATTAYVAAAGYTKGPEGRLVDASFHAGWIALSFLNDANSAKAHFLKMRSMSTLPDTITQANYWLGRAEARLGNVADAKAAYEKAAEYGMVYYGLLARAELGLHGVDLRPLPAWQQSESLFNGREVVKAIRLFAANGRNDYAEPLLRHFGTGLTNAGELLLAARLAQEIGAHQLAISIADAAERRGIPLDLFNYPKDGIPADTKIFADRAAVYAVARQESRFQIDAVSRSGARGLMQLMPGTAKDTAKAAGVDYSPAKLTSDVRYNALLGSTYLGAQLSRYDGSLVLAAAAYNAGPGNANKWIAAFGDPRLDNVDPVIWVELIPFQETRKYVQRVLGNYLVYRERLGHNDLTITQALRKIE